MKPRLVLTLAALAITAAAQAQAHSVDARERGFLRKGMHEGEVLYKIGKPDHEAFIVNVKGPPEEKTWTCFPEARDPQTMTIVTLKSGVVVDIERKIAR